MTKKNRLYDAFTFSLASISRPFAFINDKIDNSTNIFMSMIRIVKDSLVSPFTSFLEESEFGKTVKAVKAIDPLFQPEGFLKQCREIMIPDLLEAYYDNDVMTMEMMCTKTALIQLKSGKYEKAKRSLIDIRHMDIVTAKMIDDNPYLVLSFMAQLFVAEGPQKKESIEHMQYIVALTPKEISDNRFEWKVAEVAEKSEHENW